MKRSGFTLVELLAVIVILALIALITIPVILNVIEKSKIKTYQRSIDAYGGAVNKAIAEYLLDHEDQTSKKLTYEDIKDYIKYEGNKVECDTFEIYKDKTVYLAECKVNGEDIDYTYGTYQESPKIASATESYIGYYADVDGDGTADGVIYADLAHSKSGEWGWINTEETKYTYKKDNNLKEYTISNNKNDGNFGEKEIIALDSNSKGNSRFYVLSLSDFIVSNKTNSSNFTWCENTYVDINSIVTSNAFGAGKENTRLMINKWNAANTSEGNGLTQFEHDIWKYIQTKYNEGWYLPSIGEWVAFADYLSNKKDNPLVTFYNYDLQTDTWNYVGYSEAVNYNSVYGLSNHYWSSSKYDNNNAWAISFEYNDVYSHYIQSNPYIRLGITF